MTPESSLKDAEPYGCLFSPIDNMLGFTSIGAIVDTVTHPSNIQFSNVSVYDKIASVCQSSIHNNIIIIGFD